MPFWYRPEYLDGLTFEDPVETCRRVMPQVRALEPDLTILITHMGYPAQGYQKRINRVGEVAKAFPEFDLILGGHTHRIIESLEAAGIPYSQSGYFANWLGQVDIVYDNVTRKITSLTSRMHKVEDRFVEDPALRALVAADLEASETRLKEQIAVTEMPLDWKPDAKGRSGVQNLLATALAETAGAQVVLHGILNDDEALAAGPITGADLWRIIPYDNRIGVALLTAADLRRLLEENVKFRGKPHFMGAWGLDYEVDADKPAGERIRNLRMANGDKIHPRRRLRVAMNSFVLASGGMRFPVLRDVVDAPIARLELLDVQTRDAVRDFLERKGTLQQGDLP